MAAPTRTEGLLKARDKRTVVELFALDKRSLAAMRMGLAAFIVWDSQFGFLGSEGALAQADGALWSGIRYALLVPAVMLLMGWRTRFATIACWLAYSHAIRTSFATAGAPVPFESQVITLTLLWGMFLPLAGSFSLDARRRGSDSETGFVSVGAAGVLIQVGLIYLSAGITKDPGEWLFDATALMDVLTNPSHGTALGRALTEYPDLLSILSVTTVAVEIVGPILLFLPGKSLQKRRIFLVGTFIAFHIGLALMLTLGTFPFVMIVVWLGLLPSRFWDRRQVPRPVEIERHRGRNSVAAVALTLIVASNLITWLFFPATDGATGAIQEIARWLAVYQQWTMYSVPSTL